MRGWLSLATLSLVGLAIPIAALGEEVEPMANPDYAGTFQGDPSAEALLRTRVRNGKRRVVRFQYVNLSVPCEDGTVVQRTSGQIRIPVGTAQFHREEYIASGGDDNTYIEINGYFLSGGRARGNVVIIIDWDNPPPLGHIPNPDCSTQGRVRWTARLVR